MCYLQRDAVGTVQGHHLQAECLSNVQSLPGGGEKWMRGGEDESGWRRACGGRCSRTPGGPRAGGCPPRVATPDGAAGALRDLRVGGAGALRALAPPSRRLLEALLLGGAFAALAETCRRGTGPWGGHFARAVGCETGGRPHGWAKRSLRSIVTNRKPHEASRRKHFAGATPIAFCTNSV